jgi:hypothetical protein
MINIDTNPIAEKPSVKSRISAFCKTYQDALLPLLFLSISLVGIIAIANEYSNTQKFARGLYIEQNFERFMNGNITLNDIEILNKLGESKSLMSDWRYYNKNK